MVGWGGGVVNLGVVRSGCGQLRLASGGGWVVGVRQELRGSGGFAVKLVEGVVASVCGGLVGWRDVLGVVVSGGEG